VFTLYELIEKHRRRDVMEFLKDKKLMAMIFVIVAAILGYFGVKANFDTEPEPLEQVEIFING